MEIITKQIAQIKMHSIIQKFPSVLVLCVKLYKYSWVHDFHNFISVQDVVISAHALTRIEELMEDCFSALDTCTGQLSALVSWQCPQSNPDIQISEFKVLVDSKQYGSPIHSGIKTLRIQVSLHFYKVPAILIHKIS